MNHMSEDITYDLEAEKVIVSQPAPDPVIYTRSELEELIISNQNKSDTANQEAERFMRECARFAADAQRYRELLAGLDVAVANKQ
jgi:hypothetical protein